jgi:hypothetical protein
MLLPAAIACARLLHDIEVRHGPSFAAPWMRARYAVREGLLRRRILSVTRWIVEFMMTSECQGAQ